jgi:long-chain acyl-CoA synthetase
MTSAEADQTRVDTFPKLLAENARRWATRPAIREKDYGIWQSWTWAQVADEVRALACGFAVLGLKSGDKLAVIGDNRPQLYWSMVAAQAIGAVPVPMYQDAVADELKFVMNHSEARFAVGEDQEQIDKLIEIQADCPRLETLIYDNPRGMRDYSETDLHAFDEIQARSPISSSRRDRSTTRRRAGPIFSASRARFSPLVSGPATSYTTAFPTT